MRIILVLLSAILVGCRHWAPVTSDESDPTRQFRPAPSRGQTSRATSAKPTAKPPKISLINEINGRVAAVNHQFGFVVVDFYLSQMPKADQRLSVYRQGQKVGEIKISQYESYQNVAADIVAGEARIGDEVRFDGKIVGQ